MKLMKKSSLIGLSLFLIPLAAFSQRRVSYPSIYPFVPERTQKIFSDVKTVTEDPNFHRNFRSIVDLGLSKARTRVKPWSASYWPLSKGTIADPYEDSTLGYFVDPNWLNWEGNYRGFENRLSSTLANVDRLSEKDLEKLAPSEKYDLLLGDRTFDLTRRLWDYMNKWGSLKHHAFITKLVLVGDDSLDLAQDYIARNWYKDVDDAFQRSWNLRATLSAQIALDLVAKGRYRDASSAFNEAIALARADSDNYVLEKRKTKLIAAWEGICNGWSTAAGLVPRPRRSVTFKLPSGKRLKFFPEDIKGLISLYYVNSLIQDNAEVDEKTELPVTQGVVSAGLRCNLKAPERDAWGRFFDSKDDPFSMTASRSPRCSGVHPATWHLGLVNLIGKQGRSFIVERKVGDAVDNHPMYGYEFKYFNPNSGWNERKLEDNIVEADERDQFAQFRNQRTKFVVGVEAKITFLNYKKPKRKETDSESDDKEVDHHMVYDLELDENFDIIGGQWRVIKVGFWNPNERSIDGFAVNNQPDFFWAITKNFKKSGWFDDLKSIPAWSDKSKAPPASWLSSARGAHAFMYKQTVAARNAAVCQVRHTQTRELKDAICELSTNRPQPLSNVVNALIELSK